MPHVCCPTDNGASGRTTMPASAWKVVALEASAHVDPASVQGLFGLATLLKAVGNAAQLPSYRDIERRSKRRLSRSSIGDMLSGKRRFPLERMLLYLRLCAVRETELIEWTAAWHRAMDGADKSKTSDHGRAARFGEADPIQLGVKPATLHSRQHNLPRYVDRDIDESLRRYLRGQPEKLDSFSSSNAFALLVGPPAAGKTRTAYEACRIVAAEYELVQADSVAAVQRFAEQPIPESILWLDDLQLLLGEQSGLRLETILAILSARPRIIIVATIWASQYDIYFHGDVQYRNEERILQLAETFFVSGTFSQAETYAAGIVAKQDTHIRAAMDSRDYGLTQVLVGAPHLVRRFVTPPDIYCGSVLRAAIDAWRLGVINSIPRSVLLTGANGYLADHERSPSAGEWADQALVSAEAQLAGQVRCLWRRPPKSFHEQQQSEAEYSVTEYLAYNIGWTLRLNVPPEELWTGIIQACNNSADLVRVGHSAMNRSSCLRTLFTVRRWILIG